MPMSLVTLNMLDSHSHSAHGRRGFINRRYSIFKILHLCFEDEASTLTSLPGFPEGPAGPRGPIDPCYKNKQR